MLTLLHPQDSHQSHLKSHPVAYASPVGQYHHMLYQQNGGRLLVEFAQAHEIEVEHVEVLCRKRGKSTYSSKT